jgi:glutamate-1-semialdehyde 2,1-aminomutase
VTPERAYAERTPGSAAHHRRLQALIPGGVTSDHRLAEPHPLAIAHAAGARKRDLDGNEYIDYIVGNGALILGHAPPAVMSAVAEQLHRGTHYAASHAAELRWAETVLELLSTMDMVRATASGTEATLLAVRIARAATGRRRIVRFRGHYHGWHDHLGFGVRAGFDGTAPPGILQEVADQVSVLDPSAIDPVESLLRRDRDVAAVILEPAGGLGGQFPVARDFLQRLRAATAEAGALLIFDEVQSGFRCALGGAQQLLGVVPDLTTLGKIPFGGFAGGAVAGRRAIMEVLLPDPGRHWSTKRLIHHGTYNGNPVAAVAGAATLDELRRSAAPESLNRRAASLRAELNRLLARRHSNWVVYGDHSCFHVLPSADPVSVDGIASGAVDLQSLWARVPPALMPRLRCALAVCGVDLNAGRTGLLSTAHGDREIDETLAAFDRALDLMDH